jgi:hypothetical protein
LRASLWRAVGVSPPVLRFLSFLVFRIVRPTQNCE